MKLPKVNVHVPPFRNGICRYTLRIPWVAVRISFTDQKTDLWAKRCWCQSSFFNTFCLRYKAKDEGCYIIKLSIEWDKIVFMDVFKFWTSRFKFSNRILFQFLLASREGLEEFEILSYSNPRRKSRVCKTRKSFQLSKCLDEATYTQKKVLYCFYKMVLKIRANLNRHNLAYIRSSKYTNPPINGSARTISVTLSNHFAIHWHLTLIVQRGRGVNWIPNFMEK